MADYGQPKRGDGSSTDRRRIRSPEERLAEEQKRAKAEQIIPCQPYYVPGDTDPSEYWSEIESQTDRGAAVLGASFLEWRIRGAIETRFVTWDNHMHRIFGNDSKGGKLSFWEQSEVAYGLGLIGPITLSDLEKIGQIRNKFAHQPSIRSFDHRVVSSKTDQLQTPEYVAARIEAMVAGEPTLGRVHRPQRRREKYTFTVHEIANALWTAGRHYILECPRPKLPHWYW